MLSLSFVGRDRNHERLNKGLGGHFIRSRRRIDGYMVTFSGLVFVITPLTRDALHGASIQLYPRCRGLLDTLLV